SIPDTPKPYLSPANPSSPGRARSQLTFTRYAVVEMRGIRTVQRVGNRRPDIAKTAAQRTAALEVMPFLGVRDEMPPFKQQIRRHGALLPRDLSNSGILRTKYGASVTQDAAS